VEFAEAVRRRRMVRAYRPDPVDPVALSRILDAGRRGPSAGFSQGLDFVVVTAPETRLALARICGEDGYSSRGFPPWLSTAAVHVLPCVREGAYRERYAAADKAGSGGPGAWHVPYWWVDGGAALLLLLLAAVDEGLAAGFLDVADPDAVRSLLGIPADVAPLGLVTIGHAANDERASSSLGRGRRPLDDVVHRERW
jgi:nitroreductase